MSEDIIPFKEWCLKNGISLTTGYRLLNSGKLKAHKLGKLTFIKSEDDKAFMDSLEEYKPKDKNLPQSHS